MVTCCVTSSEAVTMILVRNALISSFFISLVAASVVTSSPTNNPLAIPEFSAATTPLTFSTSFITSRPTEYGYIAGNGHFSLFPSSLQGNSHIALLYTLIRSAYYSADSNIPGSSEATLYGNQCDNRLSSELFAQFFSFCIRGLAASRYHGNVHRPDCDFDRQPCF